MCTSDLKLSYMVVVNEKKNVYLIYYYYIQQ